VLASWATSGLVRDARGIAVVRGRPFTEGDRQGTPPVALINQAAAARFWPGEDPIGKTLRVLISVGYDETEPRTVVGIVRDFRSEVTWPARPEMYVPTALAGASFPHVAIRASGRRPAEVLAAAREVLAALDPELPMIQPASLDEMVAKEMAAPRFYLVLLSLFAVMAVASPLSASTASSPSWSSSARARSAYAWGPRSSPFF
jgi:putative ABC transport system permease protein